MTHREIRTRLAIEYRKAFTRSRRLMKLHGGFAHQWYEAEGKVNGIVKAANALGISFNDIQAELRQLEREGR